MKILKTFIVCLLTFTAWSAASAAEQKLYRILPLGDSITELNVELAKLPARLTTKESPVIGVNMADGFDWRTDAIGEHVHSNSLSAEKMAAKWFEALTNVLAAPHG